ncbi:MAG TPA: hypothetical protein VHB98_07280 [Chloroflexota bacterium]|nr:hypothetical protein [Chloroflexota bacterium]
MRTSSYSGRLLRLLTAALLSGSALLALASGDPLLILAVLSAAGGLFLLGRPVLARPTAAVPTSRGAAYRRSAADTDYIIVPSPYASRAMARQQQRPCRPATPVRRTTRQAAPRQLVSDLS